jgi:Ca-activated chloride channel family protein
MSFIWPQALILLLFVPAIAYLYVWMQKRRRRYALQYASVSLVAQAVGRGPGLRRHIPAAIYLLALTAMIFALARPQATIPVPTNTGTVILAIDVSGSMFAEDVPPNRMEATKDAVRDFVQKQPGGVKIGIVSFSDFGALVAPPTRERKPVLEAINRLRPQRGTNIGGGLQAALDAIYEGVDGTPLPASGPNTAPTPVPGQTSNTPAASIVLLSDGQSNTGPQPEVVAQEAKAAGIKVYTIGIGTPQGTVLEIQGRNVFTRLDEDALRTVADVTGGRYFNAQDKDDLRQIYDELSRERQFEDEETEITFAVTAAAMILSVIAGALGLLWFNRLP